jgi:hypothetical protein
MIRARVYTENKRLVELCQIADGYFKGYTVFGAGGSWKGKHEPSVCFEIIEDTTEKSMTFAVEDFASDIKRFNEQEAVLYTIEEIKGVLL